MLPYDKCVCVSSSRLRKMRRTVHSILPLQFTAFWG